MITQQSIKEVLGTYDPRKITIGVLGGHSALDVCHGAKKLGFQTLVVCQKGREKTYTQYYASRVVGKEHVGCVDKTIVLEKFADIVQDHVQRELRAHNTIFIHNRYFWVYCDFKEIEESFNVPIFGTRGMLKLEERDVAHNQYELLQKAGIRIPKMFDDPKKIDRLVIVKVNEAKRGYERAFFLATDYASYRQKIDEMIKKGIIDKEKAKGAVIEEYVLGAQVNLNFFYSPLDGEASTGEGTSGGTLELMGTDMRRQTDLDGFLRISAKEQLEVLEHRQPKFIETGHVAVTVKESLLEKIYAMGEAFVKTTKQETAPGIIGPFALQGAIIAEDGKEEFVIFDVSMRIPGSPGTKSTPYSAYLHGEAQSYGERIAYEIKRAAKERKLHMICT